jgi:hypothetical protein
MPGLMSPRNNQQPDKMNEIPIKSITIAPGSTIHKTIINTGQPGFGIATVVTLTDGREVASFESSRRKRDLLAWVTSQGEKAKAGNMKALFDGDCYYGTSTAYRIGPVAA